MKKKKRSKSNFITIIIIIVALIISFVVLTLNKKTEVSKELAKCIGTKSTLYIQLGCHACETQENIFGNNFQYLNVVDCFYEKEPCIAKEITATPTWIINNQRYIGVQTPEKLKELTGCN